MSLLWLKQLVKKNLPAVMRNGHRYRAAHCLPCRRRSFVRPMLEHLEDRRLLSYSIAETTMDIPTGPVEGQSFNKPIAVVYSSDGTTPSASQITINWGDKQTSQATNVTPDTFGYGSKSFDVWGQHTYNEASDPTVSLTIGTDTPLYLDPNATLVWDAPLNSTNGNQITATAGTAFSGVIGAFSDQDPNSTAKYYTVSIDWGDPWDPSSSNDNSGTIASNPNGTGNSFNVSGTHRYSNAGDYTIYVTVRDKDDSTTNFTTPMVVVAAAAPVITSNPTSQTVTEGDNASFTASASGTPTPTVQWQVSTDGGNTFSNISGATSTTLTLNSVTTGMSGNEYQAVFTNSGGSATTSAATLTVNAPTGVSLVIPRPVSTTEGQDFKGNVATFTAQDPKAKADDFFALISWGDGGFSTADIKSDPITGFDISGEHTYADEGKYVIAITITQKSSGDTAPGVSAAIVADASLTATNGNINATEGKAYTGMVASFTDANKSAAAGDFKATITWGDGHVSAGTVAANGSKFDVTGTNTYTEEGSYGVAVQITDMGGSNATVNSTMTVADAALTANGAATITGKPGAVLTNAKVATFTDAGGAEDASHYTATINWGDGTTGNGTITASGNGFTVSGSHPYSGAEAYNISVTIKDEGGSRATASTLADLRPPAPSSPPVAPPSPPSAGSPPAVSPGDQIFIEFEQIIAGIEAEIQQFITAEMAILSSLLGTPPKA